MTKTLCTLGLILCSQFIHAVDLTPAQSGALDKKIELIKKIAADSKLVEAVKNQNTTPLAEYKDMDQEKWKSLGVLDPKVRFFSKNPAAETLKALKDDSMSEIFLNTSDGTKLAFLAKTSGWSHKGKPKHDDPMAGKTWKGKVETDESTGTLSIQAAVPVLDGDKSIGSLVVGFSLDKLN